jgi:hypothetical protein
MLQNCSKKRKKKDVLQELLSHEKDRTENELNSETLSCLPLSRLVSGNLAH